MDSDTQIGGPVGRFPDTRQSVLAGTRSGDPAHRNRSYETIVAAYWKPVYRYIRLKWHKSNEDAKDLTQSFFAIVIEKNFASRYEQSRGTFRTYLQTCLYRFLAKQHEYDRRAKRNAGTIIPIDDNIAGDETLFDHECTRALFETAVVRLRDSLAERDRQVNFEIFERYDLVDDHPTYEQLATELGLSVTAVTNRLAAARRDFRSIVLEERRCALR